MTAARKEMPRSELKFRSCAHAHAAAQMVCSNTKITQHWELRLHTRSQLTGCCVCAHAATHQGDEDLAAAKDEDPEAEAHRRARVVEVVDAVPAQPHPPTDVFMCTSNNSSDVLSSTFSAA